MGFGADLQARGSHEALIRMQDTEIRLLENMKKCVTHRIKADRDYTTTLGQMILIAKKFDNNEFQSPVFQAWNTVIHETENVIRLIQDNAEKMCTKTLEKIVQLINEKRAARKSYCDERRKLEDDFSRAQEEVQKCQQDYQRSIEKVNHDKAKYEDLYLRVKEGRGGGKFDECKSKYQKSSSKLHKVHNDYVIALKEVKIHQDFYLQTTLPALLDYQQTIQQAMVLQGKEVMGEYTQLTDSSSAKFHESFQAMHKCVSSISPTAEYSSFLNQYKSDPLVSTSFDFDSKLLDDYKGTLKPNEVALDNLTLEDLTHYRSSFDDKLAFCRSKKETKEKELAQLQAEMAALPSTEGMDDLQKTSYLTQERAVQVLQREILELNCQQQKFTQLFNMLDLPLKRLGDSDPQLALELHDLSNDKDGSMNTSTVSSSGGAKLKLDAIKNTFTSTVSQIKMLNKKSNAASSPPPKPGNDEVLAEQNLDRTTLPRTGSSASSSGYQQYRMDNRNGTQGPQRLAARRLEDEEWFHGVLPRDEVVRLLKDNGDYLVRESRNKKTGQAQYVLSVMWINDYKHFIIQGAEGRWRFEGKDFATIQELISNQHSSGLPVTNKSQAILRKAILKEDWELNNEEINLGVKLGNGNFGEVFKGIFRTTDVAVKTCRETLSEDQKKTFLQEGRILKQYDHPNIVKFIGIAATSHPVMIIMEYVSGGALLQYLRNHGRQQATKQLVKMCEDASAGMAYLEDKNCIHRDLAARNCLVSIGKSNVVKISDFGMSREEEEYTVRDGLKQIPIKWTAPEALNYGKYTSLCDVWSFGILMWEIFSNGATPYPGMTNNQARDKIDMGYRMPAPEGTPPLIYALMQRCWEQQPEGRPHFDETFKELKVICSQS